MGIGCTVKHGDAWSPHCSLLERWGGRGRLWAGWAASWGVAVLLATGSWAEDLALQVNWLTW